jgi:peptide chain release factor 1
MLLERLAALEARYNELNLWLSQPDALSDQAKWREALKEQAELEEAVNRYHEYRKVLEDLEAAREMLESGDPELEELAKEELGGLERQRDEQEEAIKLLLAPKDPNDDKNVILEIRAGTGGEEAALFAMELLKMYTYYAQKKGWQMEITGISETELGGCKECTCLISGKGAYSRFKFESGAHRVQRVPETESGGRIHTSAATVAVLPEAEEVELELNPADIRIDLYRASGAGGQHVNRTDSAVRLTHIPTGVVVECQDERSQGKNKEKAMRVLRSRIYDMLEQQKTDEYAQQRRLKVGSGDRSERIRTYNYPQGRVTDHRIGLTLYKLDSFLAGDMDEMLDALALADRTERMRQETA